MHVTPILPQVEYLPRARPFKLSAVQRVSEPVATDKKDADSKDTTKPKKKIKWGFGKKKDKDK